MEDKPIFIATRWPGRGRRRALALSSTVRLVYDGLIFARSGGRNPMDDKQIGWIAAIIIGGIAGWLAEQFMKSPMGLLMNIVLGIVGAAVANWLLGFIGINMTGWIGYLIAGFIGACILIAVGRALSGAFQRT
jgi:uncharacterized membrane protein YeaQ/YmgE (transglycosylase-associated protein family)